MNHEVVKNKYRFVIIVLSVFLLFAVTVTAYASPKVGSLAEDFEAEQPVANDAVVMSKTASANEQADALAFWTHEAIAAAVPMDMPVSNDSGGFDAIPVEDVEQTDLPGYTLGGLPMPGADQQAMIDYPEDWSFEEVVAVAEELSMFGGSLLAPAGTSQVFTRYAVNQNSALSTIFPHKTIGRLTFSTPAGSSFCSASVISGTNVIVTAAHCVYDTTNNRWYSNWVFSPAYRNGSTPYGTFPYQTCWVLNSWINLSGSYNINSWADDDVAVCRMRNNSSGQTLSSRTGWLGRQWDAGNILSIHDVGYPATYYNLSAFPNAGKYSHLCTSETFLQATNVRGMGCDLGQGMSGGPWIVGYAPFAVAGYVDGVNSGIFTNQKNIFAPRFTSNNIVPLCGSGGASC